MPRATARAALCALLNFATVSSVHAEAPAPTAAQPDKRDDEARALFAAGRSAFEDGRYEDALVEFTRAHQRSGRPELLYNIGLAAMQLGRDQEALSALQRFVAAVPEAKTVEAARLRIELLQARIAQRQADDASAPAPTATPHVQNAAPPTRRRPFMWLAGGVSVALGATALGVGLKAQSDYDDLRRACRVEGEGVCSQARVDDAGLERRALATNLLAAGAGMALATGIVLFFYEGRDRAGPSVSAGVGPHSVRLLASFR